MNWIDAFETGCEPGAVIVIGEGESGRRGGLQSFPGVIRYDGLRGPIGIIDLDDSEEACLVTSVLSGYGEDIDVFLESDEVDFRPSVVGVEVGDVGRADLLAIDEKRIDIVPTRYLRS